MKKFILSAALIFCIGIIYAQNVPVSGFAKKKKADQEKSALRRNQLIKKNFPIYGLISSRLDKMPQNIALCFMPVISHSNLIKGLNSNNYQNLLFETFTKPNLGIPPKTW